ncbi:MAG TPA: NAD(P) transhydrogenase subunit alpha [Thermoplasmata archaeon]|nr:NAD(P) transhydrogenase subunit alpha [Thermoplasmata archaeon]
MPVTIAVPRESVTGERRVALVPESVKKLTQGGAKVVVESGAGAAAYYPDPEYAAAGAQVVTNRSEVLARGEIVLVVQPPVPAEIETFHPGAIVVGLLNPTRNLPAVRSLVKAHSTAFALELLPRITRAQGMDALSSQATAAGYEAVLLGAESTPKFLPMLTTAAGTIRPAKALILGAGVAGLMAIATARRLGAVVEAYDVRRAAGEQVRSLGAKFLELAINAEGTGGYARELTPGEKAQEQVMVSEAVARADLVVTTANIPGKKAPRLIGRDVVAKMRPGSVIVDLAAESGGNCEVTRPGERVVENGVTVLGPTNLPSQIAFHSSQMYSHNLQAFLGLILTPNGERAGAFEDEILQASLVVTEGTVRHAPTRDLLEAAV